MLAYAANLTRKMRAVLRPSVIAHEAATAGFSSRWLFVNSALGCTGSEIKLNRSLQTRDVITGTTDDFTSTIDQLGPDGHTFGRFVKQTEVGRCNGVGVGRGKGVVDLKTPQRQTRHQLGADGLADTKGGAGGLDGLDLARRVDKGILGKAIDNVAPDPVTICQRAVNRAALPQRRIARQVYTSTGRGVVRGRGSELAHNGCQFDEGFAALPGRRQCDVRQFVQACADARRGALRNWPKRIAPAESGKPRGDKRRAPRVERDCFHGLPPGQGALELAHPRGECGRGFQSPGVTKRAGMCTISRRYHHRKFLCCEWKVIAKNATLTRARARCGLIKTGAAKVPNILGKAC